MSLQQFLFLAAAVVFAVACRTFENRYVHKLGWLSLLGASYLGGYFLTGSHAAGAGSIALWFMLPWVEIVGRVRKLRFPMKSEVKHRFPPSRELFPDLEELSSEIEMEGFEKTDDTGWKWSETQHFMRLFYHPELRTQAAIALAQQEEYAFSYVSLTSRIDRGIIYTTTNYPFPPTMQFSPGHRMNRYTYADSMEDLMVEHADFLKSHDLEVTDLSALEAEQLSTFIEQDMNDQIHYNISVGLIEMAGNSEFRYSWRGCFYLWFEVVKDMVKV